MDPKFRKLEPLLFFVAYFVVGLVFLRVLTDWVSFAVDEGFTSYGAQRLREGQWPHRDFFFLWTPGILAWHALLQSLGASWVVERGAALVATACSAALVLRQAQDWKLSGTLRACLALGLGLWSFSLWNIPYSSWYALPFVLLGARWARAHAFRAGLCFALAFWFKQNMGILACLGACAALAWAGEKKNLGRMVGAFAAGLVIPFAGIAAFGGVEAFSRAFSQIFLFPLSYPALMAEWPRREWLAAPLTLTGLWILGLFSLQPHHRGAVHRLLRVAGLVYLGYAGAMLGQGFFLGALFLFSGLAWGLAFLLLATDLRGEERVTVSLFLFPVCGAFLQVFPRADFQHFLFVFPPTFFVLLWGVDRLRRRYTWLRGGLVFLPAIALLWGGFFFQSRLISLRTYGVVDSLGMISYGWAHRVNEEMHAAAELLRARGLRAGDPVLVLPNATSFYRISGFRNPTPHDQFFPGYVEAFGAKPEEVLAGFERAGGRFLVWQYKSGLSNPPAISAQIAAGYRLVKDFPEHFSVWEKKSPAIH